MAQIRFKKENDQHTKKNYQPRSLKFKFYLKLAILLNIIQMSFIIYSYYKHI